MKMKWNEKTKKITVIAALAAVGILTVTGISLCIYKDAPQKVEIAEAKEVEDKVDIPENNQTVSAAEDTATAETEEMVVSTEVSKEMETENTYVQSIQQTPVKTEDQKPAEASTEEEKPAEGDKAGKPEDTKKPAEQQPQKEQPSGNTDTPQHGDIKDGKIYLDGFGWTDYNGGDTVVILADDIYENGNKIGIMD